MELKTFTSKQNNISQRFENMFSKGSKYINPYRPLVDTVCVECSLEEFQEMSFFYTKMMEGIRISFGNDCIKCLLHENVDLFLEAKNKLKSYVRDYIDNVTDKECSQVLELKQEIVQMNVFFKHQPLLKKIKLVGKKHHYVQNAKYKISIGFGREKDENRGDKIRDKQSTKDIPKTSSESRSNLTKLPPRTVVFRTKEGVKLLVYQDNILDLDVTGIIYGTSGRSDRKGSLSRQIAAAAGKTFEEACINISRDSDQRSAGNLHYQFVVHAVIPIWAKYKPKSEEMDKLYQDDLYKTVLLSLREAHDIGARSVALPALGSGNNPPKLCSGAYRRAVEAFSIGYPQTSLKEIHFVDQNQDLLSDVSEQFQSIHGSKMQSILQDASQNMPSELPSRFTSAKRKAYRSLIVPYWISKNKDTGTMCIKDKLNVVITEGPYVETRVEALVSLEDEALQGVLNIAREIRRQAGDKYGKEIKELKKKIQRKRKPQMGDVFCTSAGTMQNASKVLHLIVPVSDKDINANPDLCEEFVSCWQACLHNVLSKARKLHLKSLAIPSLSSGASLYDTCTKKVLKVCIEEIIKFSRKEKRECRLEMVYIADDSQGNRQMLLNLLESYKESTFPCPANISETPIRSSTSRKEVYDSNRVQKTLIAGRKLCTTAIAKNVKKMDHLRSAQFEIHATATAGTAWNLYTMALAGNVRKEDDTLSELLKVQPTATADIGRNLFTTVAKDVRKREHIRSEQFEVHSTTDADITGKMYTTARCVDDSKKYYINVEMFKMRTEAIGNVGRNLYTTAISENGRMIDHIPLEHHIPLEQFEEQPTAPADNGWNMYATASSKGDRKNDFINAGMFKVKAETTSDVEGRNTDLMRSGQFEEQTTATADIWRKINATTTTEGERKIHNINEETFLVQTTATADVGRNLFTTDTAEDSRKIDHKRSEQFEVQPMVLADVDWNMYTTAIDEDFEDRKQNMNEEKCINLKEYNSVTEDVLLQNETTDRVLEKSPFTLNGHQLHAERLLRESSSTSSITDIFIDEYPVNLDILQRWSKQKDRVINKCQRSRKIKSFPDWERWQHLLTHDESIQAINDELRTIQSSVLYDEDFHILKVKNDVVMEMASDAEETLNDVMNILERHLNDVDAILLQAVLTAANIENLQSHEEVKTRAVSLYRCFAGSQLLIVGCIDNVRNVMIDFLQQVPQQQVIRATINEEQKFQIIQLDDGNLRLFTKFQCIEIIKKLYSRVTSVFGKEGYDICVYGPKDDVEKVACLLSNNDWSSKLLVHHRVNLPKPILKMLKNYPTKTYLQMRFQIYHGQEVYEWKILPEHNEIEILVKDTATAKALEHTIRLSFIERCVRAKNPQACHDLIDKFIQKQPEDILVYYPPPSGSEIVFYGPVDVFSRTDFSTLETKIQDYSEVPDLQILLTKTVVLDGKEYKYFMEEKLAGMVQVLEDLGVKISSVLPQINRQLILTSTNEQHLTKATTLVRLAAAECNVDFTAAQDLRDR